jgi:hypothetical protein
MGALPLPRGVLLLNYDYLPANRLMHIMVPPAPKTEQPREFQYFGGRHALASVPHHNYATNLLSAATATLVAARRRLLTHIKLKFKEAF